MPRRKLELEVTAWGEGRRGVGVRKGTSKEWKECRERRNIRKRRSHGIGDENLERVTSVCKAKRRPEGECIKEIT